MLPIRKVPVRPIPGQEDQDENAQDKQDGAAIKVWGAKIPFAPLCAEFGSDRN